MHDGADVAVQQEKTQQNLLHGVESFDKDALKHTDTKEKIILPAAEGETAFCHPNLTKGRRSLIAVVHPVSSIYCPKTYPFSLNRHCSREEPTAAASGYRNV